LRKRRGATLPAALQTASVLVGPVGINEHFLVRLGVDPARISIIRRFFLAISSGVHLAMSRFESGRGLPQSKSCRMVQPPSRLAKRLGLRQSSAAFPRIEHEHEHEQEANANASRLRLSLAYFRRLPFFQSMERMLHAVAKMDAHHRLLLGFFVAAIVGLALHTHALWTASLATYDAFAFAILALISVTVSLTPQERIRAVARKQDVGRTVIFLFVIIVACFALFAVAFLIRTAKPEDRHL
jgi:hypothetical protein